MLTVCRYSGAGNSFVAVDVRNIDAPRFRQKEFIHGMCLLHATDGLMLLEESETADFKMEFFNPDGSGGMMCGNGGRCIVAFADYLGVKPFHTADYVFEAADGLHRAQILSHLGECKVVRLQMRDVTGPVRHPDGWFVDTGARHFVTFVEDVRSVDVQNRGKALRTDPRFAPQGANADFVEVKAPGELSVRTFEKGVEAETLACGTGCVASAVAASLRASSGDGHAHYRIDTRQDVLEVDFVRSGESFSEVYLTGPTLCEGSLSD